MFYIFSQFIIFLTIFAQEKHLKITIKEQLHIKSKWLEPAKFNFIHSIKLNYFIFDTKLLINFV